MEFALLLESTSKCSMIKGVSLKRASASAGVRASKKHLIGYSEISLIAITIVYAVNISSVISQSTESITIPVNLLEIQDVSRRILAGGCSLL